MPTDASSRTVATPAAGGPRHLKAMRESAMLTEWWRQKHRPEAMAVTPDAVIDVLKAAKVQFVLMGAHAAAGWLEQPRSTRDVDVLVKTAHHRKAVAAISEAFPTLRAVEHPVVTRFHEPTDDAVVIDVMKPMHEVHQAVFKNTIDAQGVPIPRLEMMLATKFAAMVSPNRAPIRKQQDGVDFAMMVLFSGDQIDRDRLAEFGDLVYAGGGDEIISLLDDVLAGRMIRF